MLDHGLRAYVNSDDPAYFPGYMNENLAAVQAEAELARDELVQLARNAFTIAWLGDDERRRVPRAARRLRRERLTGSTLQP